MKRERATRLLADMITRLEDGGWPLGLVDEVYVFGSYARGALEPNDVDVVIEHGTDKRWLGESLDASINGRDSYGGMRQALRGWTRGISFQFRGRSSLLDEGFELFLLWRKGEPFSLARERLASLTADPEAGPAPRDHMLAELEGLESLVPRPARIELFGRHVKDKISITPLRLLDGDIEDPEAVRHVRRRWVETSRFAGRRRALWSRWSNGALTSEKSHCTVSGCLAGTSQLNAVSSIWDGTASDLWGVSWTAE
ncbi:nucleotidyltransferase domain-containing protein [Streptomyces sp. KLMMK]|uniref:nucleotidyltransferase domain-containing protein n=1 Tax=Streptomyces sp. KLMMK TaxID=3109353 RepID=UPI003009BD8E